MARGACVGYKDGNAHDVETVDYHPRSKLVVSKEVHPDRILKRELKAPGRQSGTRQKNGRQCPLVSILL